MGLSFKYLIKINKNENIILALIALALSIILVGENWWARYIPQFYLFIILSILIIQNIYNFTNKKYLKLLNIIICTFAIINSSLFIYAKKFNFEENKKINNEIQELQNSDNEILIGNEGLYGVLYNLYDKNISFTINNNLNDTDIKYYFSWKLRVKR